MSKNVHAPRNETDSSLQMCYFDRADEYGSIAHRSSSKFVNFTDVVSDKKAAGAGGTGFIGGQAW
ncbi:hypothetical protein C8Z91_05855 [Paenibacillus elgii]|uniref:Uncharacterized protein n=1 Tax=Paenibacillus elgii TaxID=189691 RepID=A0A2T6G791_9BACL|nr:hypothetical protein C8Z91_05855 [Paenibacillus elgii]